MIKKGYYYYLQNRSYNFTPVKLNNIEDKILTFSNLLVDQEIKLERDNYREIAIEPIHLERIGFKNEQYKDVYCHALHKVLGKDSSSLTHRFYGYYVFHKDELVEIQNAKNRLEKEISETFEKDPNFLFKTKELKDNFKTIFTVNELFDKLNSYNIPIGNKNEIITG